MTDARLQKLHDTVSFLGYICASLAVGGVIGVIPLAWALAIGLAGVLFNGLADAPLLSPVHGSTLTNRALTTLATLCALASASTYFTGVQHLMTADHAQRLGTAVLFVGQLAARYAQGNAFTGVPGRGAVIALVALLGFGGVTGCAHFRPVVDNVAHDVEVCAGPACADAAKKAIPKITEIIMCEAAAGFSPAALPPCASAALASWAKDAGPDGWRIVGCVVSAIEKDITKPPELRARARAAMPVAARMANGR